MEMTKLAALTRIDKDLPKGQMHLRKGEAVFHSEAERYEWLRQLENYCQEKAENLLILELLGPRYDGTVEEELC
jgi:hypothetical protein